MENKQLQEIRIDPSYESRFTNSYNSLRKWQQNFIKMFTMGLRIDYDDLDDQIFTSL